MRFLFAREYLRDLFKLKFPVLPDNNQYIESGFQWICAAQDSSEDDGIARSYSLVDGWEASYPETTGYIIPTIFDYYHYSQDESAKKRALRMADWLVNIQCEGGGISAGTVAASNEKPTIFNTGQVIFGWIRAYEETLEKHYLKAFISAADWLVKMQDEDGVWRKAGSKYVRFNVNTYNARTAWALLRASAITGKNIYKKACLRNINWALSRQNSKGWFEDNCLDNQSAPYIHTIAYATRGILEVGLLLKDNELISAAKKAADAILKRQRPDGSMSGRYDRNWSPVVKWSCLPGNAQISIIWLKLYQLTGDSTYLLGANKCNQYLKSLVNLKDRDEGIRGGLKGAHPIWGPYGEYQYLNWSVKFFLDSLMLEKENRQPDH